MAIEYNKKKDRNLFGGGPRDLQRRQQREQMAPAVVSSPEFYETIIKDLKDQLKQVTDELLKRGSSFDPLKKYTAEEFDEELIKQVTIAVENKEKELVAMKAQVIAKDELIAAKDETISSLRLRGPGVSEEVVEDPDRPSMETVFIDPTEKNDGSNMQSHITVESKEDTKIGDKVNKLKSLIGGLPKK